MSTDFSQLTARDICAFCQTERVAFRRGQGASSPACVELFRRAFHSHATEAAWECLKETFEPLIVGWVRQQTRFEVEDIVQETWLNFYKGTSQRFQIQDNHHLEPILAFLKKCMLTVLAQRGRARPHVAPGSLDEITEFIQDQHDPLEQARLRVDLERYLADFLEQDEFTDEDRLLFTLKFVLHLKPREIMVDYPQLASDYGKLENDLQRITRRVVKYEGFRNLHPARRKADDNALLKVVVAPAEGTKDINVDQPCTYEEAILLDYIMGLVDTQVAAAIQASPACLQQVSQLTQTLGPFLMLTYRLNCPSPPTLVAYQQRTLPGSERLVLYRHLEQCPRCREDLVILDLVDQAESVRATHLLRRVIEALYHSPVALGLQGGWLHYRTPEIFINISSRQNHGQARSWQVRAQVRTHEGQIVTPTVQAATLEAIEQQAAGPYQLDRPTGDNSLVFREVQAGNYCLSIVMPNEEIVIRSIIIGEGS